MAQLDFPTSTPRPRTRTTPPHAVAQAGLGPLPKLGRIPVRPPPILRFVSPFQNFFWLATTFRTSSRRFVPTPSDHMWKIG